ncbi:MAG: GC-type dockerin domain-anchored protein [Planctomycetota bacterium]
MPSNAPVAFALALTCGLAATASASRDVQVRSIDFETGVLEVFNFGTGDVDLTGWRFCSHDFDQQRRYTQAAALTGVMLEAGSSIFVHFNNDAPADPDRFNRSALGNFAVPLDQDAYGLQFFFPAANGNVSFGNSSLISDHVQWNIDGQTNGLAEARTGQAVGQGLWSAAGDFIATQADSLRIDLTDLSGDIAGSPAEYLVTNPAANCNPADLAAPLGVVDLADVDAFIAAFLIGGPAADIAAPAGVVDLADVDAFIAAFLAGCP